MMQLSRLASLAASSLLLLATAGGSPAIAQEQENPSTPGQIPNPGTYQGSQVLQQQSDAQDQAFRQQQQQQNSQQYGNQGGGRNFGSNGRAPTMNPWDLCGLNLNRSPTVAPLRGLVVLGGALDDHYFAISRRPTPTEKSALLQWMAGRKKCLNVSLNYQPDPEWREAMRRASGMTDDLTIQLLQGRITFGQFNRQRAQASQYFARWADAHRR